MTTFVVHGYRSIALYVRAVANLYKLCCLLFGNGNVDGIRNRLVAIVKFQHHESLLLASLVRVKCEGISCLSLAINVNSCSFFYSSCTEMQLCLIIGCGERVIQIVCSLDGYSIRFIYLSGGRCIHLFDEETVGCFKTNVLFNSSSGKRHTIGSIREEAFAGYFNLIGEVFLNNRNGIRTVAHSGTRVKHIATLHGDSSIWDCLPCNGVCNATFQHTSSSRETNVHDW